MTVVGETKAEDTPKVEPKASPEKEQVKEEKKEGNVFDDVDSPSDMKTDEKSLDVLQDAKLPGVVSNEAEGRVNINTDSYEKDELVITPDEKSAFIDAMITGKRYMQSMDIFGGKIHVTVRSRTAAETHAMYAYIRHVLANRDSGALSTVEGDMAFVPLVAQIEEMNGVKFPEMKAPLTFEMQGDKEVQPGWYEDFKAWKAKPEGLTSALISCVQLFEYKYWTMTKEAANKNFWNSDTSIEE